MGEAMEEFLRIAEEINRSLVDEGTALIPLQFNGGVATHLPSRPCS